MRRYFRSSRNVETNVFFFLLFFSPTSSRVAYFAALIAESSLPGPELEFIKTPTPVIATIGGQASFCVRTRTTGRQPVEVQWEVDNVPISDFSKYQVRNSKFTTLPRRYPTKLLI